MSSSYYAAKTLDTHCSQDIHKYLYHIIQRVLLLIIAATYKSNSLTFFECKGVRKESYSSTEVVLVAEILKLLASAYISLKDISETGVRSLILHPLLIITIYV